MPSNLDRADLPSPTRLVISFTNNRLRRPGGPILGIVDLDLNEATFSLLPLPAPVLSQTLEATGLAADDTHVYAAVDGPGGSRLLTLDRQSLDLLRVEPLPECADPHSIAVVDGRLYVVSTGTDSLVRYRLKADGLGRPKLVWRPNPALSLDDHHHLNGLLWLEDHFLVSGLDFRSRFRTKPIERFRLGFVQEVHSGAFVSVGLHDPHSLARIGDTIGLCQSDAQSVLLWDRALVRQIPGYCRGLCAVGTSIYVGSSSTNNAMDQQNRPWEASWRCTISRLDLDTLAITASIDLSDQATGIYDLLPV